MFQLQNLVGDTSVDAASPPVGIAGGQRRGDIVQNPVPAEEAAEAHPVDAPSGQSIIVRANGRHVAAPRIGLLNPPPVVVPGRDISAASGKPRKAVIGNRTPTSVSGADSRTQPAKATPDSGTPSPSALKAVSSAVPGTAATANPQVTTATTTCAPATSGTAPVPISTPTPDSATTTNTAIVSRSMTPNDMQTAPVPETLVASEQVDAPETAFALRITRAGVSTQHKILPSNGLVLPRIERSPVEGDAEKSEKQSHSGRHSDDENQISRTASSQGSKTDQSKPDQSKTEHESRPDHESTTHATTPASETSTAGTSARATTHTSAAGAPLFTSANGEPTSGIAASAPRSREVSPAMPAEPVSDKTVQSTVGRPVAVRIENPDGQAVEIRIGHRAGELNVDVRTANAGLSHDLREDLGDLESRLRQNGYRADALDPAHSGVAIHNTGAEKQTSFANGQSQQDPQQSPGRGQRDQSQGDQNHTNEDQRNPNKRRWQPGFVFDLTNQSDQGENSNGISS